MTAGESSATQEAALLVEASRVSDEDVDNIRDSHERLTGHRRVGSINWFIPDVDNPFYGGIHTILRFADHFRQRGVENRFIVLGLGSEEQVRSAVTRAFPGLADAPILVSGGDRDFERDLPHADAAVASLWSTVYALVRSRCADRYFYFVQDFEPMFYPAGTSYALAEETYRMGLYGVVNGPVLKDVYESYVNRAVSFMPCVDTEIFHPGPGRSPDDQRFKVFLYGRPGHPRNCYELGISALRHLRERLGDRLHVVTAGADQPQPSGTEDWIQQLGLLGYEETARLYRECDAGLVLSVSMHPSYIPLQLMASGALVVSNRNPATGWLLRDGENCLLGGATTEDLAGALHHGLTEPAVRRTLTVQALEDIRTRHSDWVPQMERVFRFIEDPTADSTSDANATPSVEAIGPERIAAMRPLDSERHYRAQIKTKDLVIEQRDAMIREQEAVIEDREGILIGKAEQIMEKDLAIARRDEMVAERDRAIAAYQSTALSRFASGLQRWLERVAPWGTRRRGVVVQMRAGLGALLDGGLWSFLRWLLSPWRWVPGLFRAPLGPTRVPSGIVVADDRVPDPYQMWLRRHHPRGERLGELRDEAHQLQYRPLISVLVPAYRSDPRWLREAIDSVRAQVYEHWELCVVDDGSARRDLRKLLRRYRRGDQRIRIRVLRTNQGIAGASNEALAMSRGDFVALLDHDDILQPDALFEVVKLLNERRDLDYIYTDEDKLDLDGRRLDPLFKPDWSPDLLLSLNYVTHLSVFRREVLDQVGGFRRGFEGSQDYDLVLRATELTDRIAHVPKPLYSWRTVPGSAAGSDEAKPYAYEAAKRALAEALERRGHPGMIDDGVVRGYYRARYPIRGAPSVAIVIPTRDRVDLLRRCISSIRERSTYSNYQIVVLDNDSTDPETKEYLAGLDAQVIPYPETFNFARMMNIAVSSVDAEFVLFLNNDTEVVSPDWIEALVEHGQRPEVAAVGARLLFPDGTSQHEGILVGPGGGLAGNLDTRGYFLLGRVIRNCSAVTAACMLLRREIFRELGGFEERLAVAYNDVDLCLRAREKGYLIVYTPFAELLHHEGGTRGRTGRTHPEAEERLFRARWGTYRDPYYNPNLDIDRPFEIAAVGDR